MAIAITGSAVNNGSSGTAVTITHGLTINSGDLVIAHVHGGAVTVVDNNGGDSFTRDFHETYPTFSARVGIFSRVAGGSEPATYNFTLGSSSNWTVSIVVFSGADTSSIYDVAPVVGNLDSIAAGVSTTMTATTVTTSNANSMAIMLAGTNTSGTPTFSGITNGFTESVATSSVGQGQTVNYKTISTAGAVGNTSVTLSAQYNAFGILYAVNEAAPGLSITSTTTPVFRGQTNVTINGSGFGATKGSSTLEYGSVASGWIEIDTGDTATWGDTQISNITIPSSIALQHDATGYKFRVTVV